MLVKTWKLVIGLKLIKSNEKKSLGQNKRFNSWNIWRKFRRRCVAFSPLNYFQCFKKMNKEILKKVGFEKEVNAVEQNKCPTCGDEIDENEFSSEDNKREYIISGMCQDCIEETFFARV